MTFELSEIVAQLGGELRGDGRTLISQVASLEGATAGEISFVMHEKYRHLLSQTAASAVVLPSSLAGETDLPCIISNNVHAYFAKLCRLLNPEQLPPEGIHPTAIVAATAEIDPTVSVGAHVVIGERVKIGAGSVIFPGTFIDHGVHIGSQARLYANVSIYHECHIGDRAIIHSGAVIGSDGFGFANERGTWQKIPQIGRVILGDDVEIGSNTTIDRGALDDTIIGNGVKIDNLVHVGHNCVIGDHSIFAATIGIAGSTHFGQHCAVGGAAKISGHLHIVDNVEISPATTVLKDIPAAGKYTSIYPYQTHNVWKKNAIYFNHLHEMAQRIKALEKALSLMAPTESATDADDQQN